MDSTTVARTEQATSVRWWVRVEDVDPTHGPIESANITCCSLYAALTVAWAQACRCYPARRRTISIHNGYGQWQESIVVEGTELRLVEDSREEEHAQYAARRFATWNQAE